MAAALALAVLLASPPRAIPAAVSEAILAGAAPGARVELVDLRPAAGPACAPDRARALAPVSASGRVALRLEGRDARGAPCEAWAWARVRVFARALVAARAVRAAEPLAGAVSESEVELAPGRAPVVALPEGAVAARALPAGAPLDPAAIQAGPRPGEPVQVIARAGALEVAQPGRAVACARGRGCALLPSGRRVEGRLEHGRIVLEAP